VPYERFVLRVSEEDFLRDPHGALDSIRASFLADPGLMEVMRGHMARAAPLLSWDPLPCSPRPCSPSVRPLELFLQELGHQRDPHGPFNNIPCTRPYMCRDRDRLNQTLLDRPWVTPYSETPSPKKGGRDYTFYKPIRPGDPAAWRLTPYSSGPHSPLSNSSGPHSPYSLRDQGLQVNPLLLSLSERRSHLCRHSSRLVGHYKLVFYMQVRSRP